MTHAYLFLHTDYDTSLSADVGNLTQGKLSGFSIFFII